MSWRTQTRTRSPHPAEFGAALNPLAAAGRELVEGIDYWASDALNATPHPLRLDERHLSDADEAWVPVLTPDGPGILVWSNSD
jgi:hypothetical protein